MTAEQLAAIRERAENATSGPWYSAVLNDAILTVQTGLGAYVVEQVDFLGSESDDQAQVDAEFIAYAREDIPALLARVEALQKRNEKLEAVREAAKEPYLFIKALIDSTGFESFSSPAMRRRVVAGWSVLQDALTAAGVDLRAEWEKHQRAALEASEQSGNES